MSLNTVEGWNAYVKEGHSQILMERGIEPTEENLMAFQVEVKALVDELEEKVKIKREKEQLKVQHIEQEAQEMLRIFGKTKMGLPPYDLIEKVYEKTLLQKWGHVTGRLAAVWFVGYVIGIRAERARRNGKSPAVGATTCGAAEKHSTKQYTTI